VTRLSRRQLVLSAGSAALLAGCGRLPWQAQPARVPRIGFLASGPPETEPSAARYQAFRDGLRELGYAEGQNILIEWRYTRGSNQRFPELAAELVSLPVDLIVAEASPAVQAAKQATTTIPIVFPVASDPIATGLVASLAHPGGNATGLSLVAKMLYPKRVELLKEAVPDLARVAILGNMASPSVRGDAAEAWEAAELLGLRPRIIEVTDPDNLGSAFAAASEAAQAIVLVMDPVLAANTAQLADLAARSRLPTIAGTREFTEAGGLMAYGPNNSALFRRAATYVDKILKGTKPADLPVEQPMRFDFVVNMRTARELGITFPHEVALQITEVIDG
jgi:putative ABC transport system substrate-binding protein